MPTLPRPRLARLFAALLMPAVLGGCASVPGLSGAVQATARIEQPRLVPVFVASTRPEGAGDVASPLADPRFARIAVSLPPGRAAGSLDRPTFSAEDRRRHVVLDRSRPFSREAWRVELSSSLAGQVVAGRDVLVFVHGYNTPADEAVMRAAQITADGGFRGLPVAFTWPSRARTLGYLADREVATASRDGLEAVLDALADADGVGRVHILAHSMGAFLAMETLRQMAIGGRGTLRGRLGEVMLAHPDLDLDVFRAQLNRLPAGTRVSLFVQSDDRALQLSSRLAGDRTRLGALDLTDRRQREAVARLGVRVYDLTPQGRGDFVRHGTFAEAPEVVRLIGGHLEAPAPVDGLADEVAGAPPAAAPAPADITGTTGPR